MKFSLLGVVVVAVVGYFVVKKFYPHLLEPFIAAPPTGTGIGTGVLK